MRASFASSAATPSRLCRSTEGCLSYSTLAANKKFLAARVFPSFRASSARSSRLYVSTQCKYAGEGCSLQRSAHSSDDQVGKWSARVIIKSDKRQSSARL